jgi:hypothetical protein
MAEPSNQDYPAKSARRKDLAAAADLPHAIGRRPRRRIGKQNSSLG